MPFFFWRTADSRILRLRASVLALLHHRHLGGNRDSSDHPYHSHCPRVCSTLAYSYASGRGKELPPSNGSKYFALHALRVATRWQVVITLRCDTWLDCWPAVNLQRTIATRDHFLFPFLYAVSQLRTRDVSADHGECAQATQGVPRGRTRREARVPGRLPLHRHLPGSQRPAKEAQEAAAGI